MKLIIGLGNPGGRYTKTRHNIGFETLDYIVGMQANFSYKNNFGGELAEYMVDGEKVLALKPMEFMNRSGGAIQKVMHFYKLGVQDILVVHDEIDLPVGTIKYKFGGGLAGHNGLKDIANKLGTQDFARIRIGVDRPLHKEQVADYVLSTFKKEEKEKILDAFVEVDHLVKDFLEK